MCWGTVVEEEEGVGAAGPGYPWSPGGSGTPGPTPQATAPYSLKGSRTLRQLWRLLECLQHAATGTREKVGRINSVHCEFGRGNEETRAAL